MVFGLIFDGPRSFAADSSGVTHKFIDILQEVLRARPTSRWSAAGMRLSPSRPRLSLTMIERPNRDLPIPVHDACAALPSSLRPRTKCRSQVHDVVWDLHHGHPAGSNRVGSFEASFVVYHPARSRVLLRIAQEMDFPRVDSSRNRT
jgi:hypothetical protein